MSSVEELQQEIVRLQAIIDQQETYIDQLEWEVKGVEEWRSIALGYRDQIRGMENRMQALLERLVEHSSMVIPTVIIKTNT